MKYKSSKSLFSSIDLFGTGYKFLVDGKESFKTSTGASMTIIYILTVVGLFFGFGVDLYQRKNPKVSLNTENQPYQPIKLSNNNFTYAFRIEDTMGKIQLDETIASIVLNYGNFEVRNGNWIMIKDIHTRPKRCHEFPNYKSKEEQFNISLESWFCLDFDDYVWGGNWDGNFVNFINVIVQQCINSTDSNVTCASQEKILNQFENKDRTGGNMFFSDLSLYIQPSLNNYENPLSTTLVNNYQLLSLDITKRKVQTYKSSAIENDVGWLFENIIYDYFLNIDDILTDFYYKDRWNLKILYNSFLYIGKKVETYRRSYTKFQEVLAAIGGFAKIFYSFLLLINTFVHRINQDLKLIERISYNEEGLDKKLKFEVMNKVRNLNTLKILKKEASHSHISFDKVKPGENINESRISFSDYIYHALFKKNDTGSKLDRYQLYKQDFNKKLDISSYINLHHKLDILEKILLTKEQRMLIKFVKPKLKENEHIDEKIINEVDNSGVSKSYTNLMKINDRQLIDDKLKLIISMMEENVKQQFEN